MSIPKRRLFASFWDLPPPDSLPGHINPKTIWDNSIPGTSVVDVSCRYPQIKITFHAQVAHSALSWGLAWKVR